MTSWKALANAVIHNGFDPLSQVTIIACEKCQNPFMHIVISNQYPIFIPTASRITITIYECPECGHKELDCFGTYEIPDYLPGSIMPFIGHFFELWFAMLNYSRKLERGEVQGND